MKYKDEKFYWTYQRGIGWPDDWPDDWSRFNDPVDNRKISGFH